jgi:transposase InsO family protein
MPWKESRISDQRLQFLSSYQKEEMSVADLCREYGISRPTGYRWINRYNETGPEGLVDLSRRPHSCSHATLEPIDNAIFALRANIRPGARGEAAMREYGVPARIRTDNGAPFAGTGLLGLSKLSLGWMKLGIVHERIQAGRPQQNGRHERMHRTLKEDTTKPPSASLRAQQSRFNSFRNVFKNERPHEGLNNQSQPVSTTPARSDCHANCRDSPTPRVSFCDG